MPLKLSPMLWEDIDDFGVIDELAMEQWTFARLMDNSGRPRREFVAEWARSDWSKDEKAHWLKVADTETGEMIAMALWRLPVQHTMHGLGTTLSEKLADAGSEIEAKGVPESEATTVPEGEAKTKKFWGEVEELKKSFFQEFIGEKVHAYLHLLITHPSYRRKGAGSMLVKWGCDQADELGIICALTASTDGEFVYRKSGFEVKKAVELDLSPFGVDEIELRRFMVREPKSV